MTKNTRVPFFYIYITFVTQGIFRLFAYPTLYLTKGMRIHDSKNLEHAIDTARSAGQGILIGSNHVTMLDFAYLQCALLRTKYAFSPIFFVTNTSEHFKSSSFGFMRYFMSSDIVMNSIGAWRIQKGRHDYAFSLSNHLALLSRGYIIAIFPEGGISSGKVHGGAGYIAATTKCIVEPMRISEAKGRCEVYCLEKRVYGHVEESAPDNFAEQYRMIAKNILN